MILDRVNGYSKKTYKRLFDKVGALEKGIKMRRMEPYADVINSQLEKYNSDDDSRTMMFKLVREPVEGTTTRRKHTENVAKIAGEIADNFDWLNPQITRVMARHHDIGHTFLGHSGEWWLSSIKDTYAMGNYVHNALGARKLVYRENFYDEVEQAIKEQYPDISSRKLAKIKEDLWLVVDGINAHNGEKSEYSYSPDFSKTNKSFLNEITGCFIKKGFDRTIDPATAEGSLMRLSDKISYIPFDLVDTFRNHCNIGTSTVDGQNRNYYEEYRDKFRKLGMPEDSLERLLACKTEEDYDNFAYEIQDILIEDVKKNSKRNNIRMSPEMAKVMHGIRDINNSMMVNYTVMKEDHDVYPEAMEHLMQKFAHALIHNGLIDAHNIENSSILHFENNEFLRKEYRDTYKYSFGRKFAEFVTNTTKKDFDFTVDMVKKAFDETIDAELEVARSIADGTVDGVSLEAKGDKKVRLDSFIDAFNESLDTAYEENVFDQFANGRIDRLKKKWWLDKTEKKLKNDIMTGKGDPAIMSGIKPLNERVALEIGAQFLSTLNDKEWEQILFESREVDKDQMASLKRPYQSFDFRSEAQKHKDWDNIAKLQAKGTASVVEKTKKKGALAKVKKFLGFEREDR